MRKPHRRHRAADHVEPADRRGRGAGADAAAHRLLRHRARGGRPLRRHLRPRRAACWRRPSPARRATSTRWRSRSSTSSRHFRPRDHEAGRRLHHQRSVDGHRPPQRLRRDHAVLPQGQAGRPVLLHLAPDGHRRHRLRARWHRRVHGGPLHPVPEAARGGQGQRDADGDDPRQHAAADRHRRRRLFARRLQRGRLPAARSR